MKYNYILQIDDDAEDCDFFSEALQSVSNATYLAIHNAKDALIKLEKKVVIPDIIFLDLNMPKMNGTEFLIELKKREFLKHIPVIIFSTSPVTEMMFQTKDLGACDYITKPSDYSTLKKLLQQRFSS
ncbi:MAG TPA: response regulator [Flavobacterium sp.]|jgi:CheY-like chemotaxis protein